MGYVLGVDLGTTFTAAAVGEAAAVEIFPLSDRSHVIPSVLVLREDGEVLVGDAAQRRSVAEPGRAAREFKRRLGDPAPLLLGGTPYGADSLMAMLLKAVVAQVAQLRGEQPELLCLTHPASYGDFKQDLLRQVAQQADVANWVLTTEPQAAAVNHAASERVSPGDVFAVYDLGGGTFDAALVRAEEGGSFRLLGTPEGLERVGGIDFDQSVLAHVDAALDGQVSELDLGDPVAASAVARLRQECRDAKEVLSADTDASIPVMLPNLSTEVRIQRSEFEAMIRPRVDDTIDALSRAVRSAGLGVEDLTATLLVGGSSRIPLVRERVRELTNRPVALDAHPKHSIALGAARVALAGGAPTVAAAPDPAPEPELLPDDDQPQVVEPAAVAPVVVAPVAASPEPPAEDTVPDVAVPVAAAPAAEKTLDREPRPEVEPSATPASPEVAAPTSTPSATSDSRSKVPLIAAAVIAVLVVGGILFAVLGGGDDSGPSASDGPSTDGGSAEPVTVPVGADPVGVAASGDGIFVSAGDGTVSQVDANSGEPGEQFDVGGTLAGIAGDDEAVWVVATDANQVVRIDVASGEQEAFDVDAAPAGVALTSEAVWVTNTEGGTVSQLDPDDGSLVAEIGVGVSPAGIAATEDDVWVANADDSTVAHIDPASGDVTFIDVGGNPTGVAVTDDAVWVTDPESDTVIQIDPSTEEVVQSIETGVDPIGITADGTTVYVSNQGDDTVTTIDAASGEVGEPTPTGVGPAGLALADDGSLWVAESVDGTVSRLDLG